MSVETSSFAGAVALDELNGRNVHRSADLTVRLRQIVNGVDWQSQVRFNAEQRWFAPLAVDELVGDLPVEVWLLSWLPGQRTGLHDHGGSAGAFAVVRGALREDTIQSPAAAAPRLHHRTFDAGQLRPFGARHLHEVVNDAAEPAVSIHIYAPRLTRMTRYRWTANGPETVAVEEAGTDW